MIAAPFELVGGSHVTVARALPPVAKALNGTLGAVGGAVVVTWFDGLDASEGPAELLATTVKSYVVLLAKPVKVKGDPALVWLPRVPAGGAGSDVTV